MFIEEKPDYIIGDLHLGGDCGLFDKEYSRDFNSIKEYEQGIVDNWNKKITNNNAIIFFLGDLGNKTGIENIIARLRGRKFLIMGNHDNYPVSYYKQFFEGVSQTPVYVDKRVIFSHEPHPVEPGIINIHGHTHSVYLDSELHINVCPEYNGYTPLLYKKIKQKKLSEIDKPNRKFLFEWYAALQKLHGDRERDDLVMKDNGRIDVEKSKPLIFEKKCIREVKRANKDNNITEEEFNMLVEQCIDRYKFKHNFW